ncbi:MAG: hypothetical protein ACLFVB_06205 [Thermoplasmata archaeon]
MFVKKTTIQKTISIILFLFLLITSVINLSSICNADQTSNPYGKDNWELHNGSFHIIHKNNTKLEQRHDSFRLSKVSIRILKENSSWAKIKVSWQEKEYNNRYWRLHDLDYYKNLTINVRKSNNMAYIEPTDELIGFNPFHVYEYTNTKITNKGDGEITLNLDKKYLVYYISKNPPLNHLLGFQCEKDIQYIKQNLGGNPLVSRSITHVISKGHYPKSFTIYLPAEYILKNCTNEKYVGLNADLSSEQDEGIDFLKSVDNGGKPKYMEPPLPWHLIAIPVLLVISGLLGYKAYKNKKG